MKFAHRSIRNAVDTVAELQNAWPVRGDNTGALLPLRHHAAQNAPLGFNIKRTGSLVQKQDRRTAEQRAQSKCAAPAPRKNRRRAR